MALSLNNKNGNGSERLAAIEKRITAAMQELVAEKERLRKQETKERDRLCRILGGYVLRRVEAKSYAEDKTEGVENAGSLAWRVRQLLQITSSLAEDRKKLLTDRGWLKEGR